jgi:hypothetical protein
MEIKRLHFILPLVFLFSIAGFAQQTKKAVSPAPSNAVVSAAPAQAIKGTSAYAEVILRKTELESELEDFAVAYTEDFPKVKEARYELSLIEKDLAKLLSASNSDLAKLTLALGKLMVRRAELGTALWSLQAKFGADHPDVKRAQRRVSTFEKAIGDILP